MSVYDNDKILVGVIEINEAKRLKDKLLEEGVQIDLVHNNETCAKGCQTRIEFWANSKDINKVQEVLNQEVKKMIEKEGNNINHEQISSVFDSEAKTANCPACGTEFSTTLKECPDCGLVFFKE